VEEELLYNMTENTTGLNCIGFGDDRFIQESSASALFPSSSIP
jgi:hypothetical protein